MDLAFWCAQMERAVQMLRTVNLGYPPGDNRLLPPAGESVLDRLGAVAGLKSNAPLLAFYRSSGGLELPDAHVGYFIHRPELILLGFERGEPRRVSGPFARDVLVFGSDGGGGRFATGVDDEDRDILYLGEGAVQDGIFDGEQGDVRVLAPHLEAFLKRLHDDVDAFVRNDPDWDYLV